KYFMNAYAIDSSDDLVLKELILSFFALGQHVEALKFVDIFYKDHSRNFDIDMTMVDYYMKKNSPQEAINTLFLLKDQSLTYSAKNTCQDIIDKINRSQINR
ncbi:MAG: hypothetical protein JXR78_10375, partial [Victivallales bacterium]|nr:hypothetical protein [Victivallales bacterium]